MGGGKKRQVAMKGITGHGKGRMLEFLFCFVLFFPRYEAHVWKSVECQHVAIMNHLKQNKLADLDEISIWCR